MYVEKAAKMMSVRKFVSKMLMKLTTGGVLLIGGITENDVKVHDTIYKLSTLEDDWKELPQKLHTPRFGHTAFFVPDSLVNCN